KPINACKELRVQIQHTLRSRPTKREVAADFCNGVVRDEQGVRACGIGRLGSELIAPQPDRRPALQQVRDAAHNLLEPLTIAGDEIKAHQYPFAGLFEHHASPRSRRIFGWSGRSIIRCLKASLSSSRNGSCGNTGSIGAPSYSMILYAPAPIS